MNILNNFDTYPKLITVLFIILVIDGIVLYKLEQDFVNYTEEYRLHMEKYDV